MRSGKEAKTVNPKQKKTLVRILAALLAAGAALWLPLPQTVRVILYAAAYLTVGYDILIKAGKGILHGRPFDENFLMALATVGAIALGNLTEGVAVMLFYQIGELFQSLAVGKSRRSIRALMDIRPDCARIELPDGSTQTVSPEVVPVGSIVVIAPGEKIPLDGIVIEGTSLINTSALTGESVLRKVTVGESTASGCVNMTSPLRVRTEKVFSESTSSRILALAESASSRKSRSEAFISRFSRRYTPAVCLGAVCLAVVPPLMRLIFLHQSADWGVWLYRALTFLVISCPCALVISIPLSFFAGLGGASAAGVLIKGSQYMEVLAAVRCMVFDKTGTMTKGVFEVSGIHHSAMEDEKLLALAAHAECFSVHPIAESLRKAYGKDIDKTRVTDVKEIGGHGVFARVDGTEVLVGNDRLMREKHVDFMPCHHAGTVVHVALGGKYAGHILITDTVKPTSSAAIASLKAYGIRRTVMLTGDRKQVGEEIRRTLGIDEVQTELLPDGKVEALERILAEMPKNETVAYVGDGINDAPVLSRADVGIAMGALGSDAAIEASDVVLMDDEPKKLVTAVRHSQKTLRIVRENIIVAIGIKLLCLILGALGVTGMWAAVFADVGVMVLAVLNALRALRVQKD